jgi:hypothetical protein
MTHELLKRLSALRGINPRLNAVTDQVTEIVRSVEKTLVEELKVGIDASECFLTESGGEPDAFRKYYLAFSRVGSAGYRINVCIVTTRETLEENGEPAATKRLGEERILWSSCSRELKLKAVEKLPDLLDNIIKGAENLLQTADETATRIKDLLGEREFAIPPKQESRRRSRFSRAPRRNYSIRDAARAHRQYFLDQGISEAALDSLACDGWVETGQGEFMCCDMAGAERCFVLFTDDDGSAEIKFPNGDEESVSIEEE